jgi:hypothetical protein
MLRDGEGEGREEGDGTRRTRMLHDTCCPRPVPHTHTLPEGGPQW